MNTGEKITIDIIDMGMEGEGIGRFEGMAVFVRGAVPGDRAVVEITQVKKNFARGKLESLEKESEFRCEPVCVNAGRCGGCSLQSMTYKSQLKLKQKWVKDRLERIGGLQNVQVEETIGMDDPFRYRNKAQFPVSAGRLVKNNKGKYRNNQPCSVGFYQVKSHQVVQCDECLIQAEPAEKLAMVVKEYVEAETVSVYDEKSGMGLLRHLIVKSAFETGEVMAILVVNGDHLPKIEKLVEAMDDAVNSLPADENGEPYWSLESVILNVNKKKGSEIMGKECIAIAGKPTITDHMGGLQFEISPHSFYQVNPSQMKVLYDKVVEFAGLTGEETVLDLYCGVGTIGLYCASKARRVIGIEEVRSAALDANRNAVLNGIVNAEYLFGKAEEVLPKRLQDIKADVVILDPPRSGCDPALLDAVGKVAPERIVYVSCDPATLARDLKMLMEKGYQVGRVQPVDMFPWTSHVEVVIQMMFCGSNKKNKE